MATKKASNVVDFAELDTVKSSTEGRFFSFYSRANEKLDSGATMFGMDSPKFKRVHARIKAEVDAIEIENSKRKESKTPIGDDDFVISLDEFKSTSRKISDAELKIVIENYEQLELVIGCCKELHNCFFHKREMKTREDIREFFTSLPMQKDQMWFQIKGRTSFLQGAEIAG